MAQKKACGNPDHEDFGFDGCMTFVVILFGNLAVGLITMHYTAGEVAKTTHATAETAPGIHAIVPFIAALLVSLIAVTILYWLHQTNDEDDDVHDDDYR